MGQYSGIALPWDGTLQGLLEPKGDMEVLKSSVLWILMTRPGERVMLPEFGSDVPGAVFEPNDEATEMALQHAVQDAIQEWDDRIQFRDATITSEDYTIKVRVSFENKDDPLSRELGEIEVTASPEFF